MIRAEKMLLQRLPDTIEVNGKEYPFDADFRSGLRIRALWQDARLSGKDEMAWYLTLRILFPEKIPVCTDRQSAEELADKIMIYLYDGRSYRDGRKAGGEETENRICAPMLSYSYDAPDIYAAFLQIYGIDLCELPYLHLWKFDALFASLPEECRIMRLLAVRNQDLSSIRDDGERARIAAMKLLCRIPNGVESKRYTQDRSTVDEQKERTKKNGGNRREPDSREC